MSQGLRWPLAAVVVVCFSVSLGGQAPEVSRIVERFYPQRLVDLGLEAADTVERRQCHAVLDTLPGGAPQTIVAAYTNTSSAAIRVLQVVTGEFQVVAEPSPVMDLFGSVCEVTAVDLDHDGRNDLVVTFGMMQSGVTWLFKWDGQQLVNLTPVTPNGDGTLRTALHNASLVDIDNDGVKEVFVVGQYPSPADGPAKPDSVYKLSAGGYVKAEPLVGLWTFERTAGAPEVDRVSFALPEGAQGPYTLHVVNGGPGGQSRVTSAQVLVNDRQVLGPSDFGHQVDVIDRPVSLDGDNQLSVRLAGAPGSRMLVILRSHGWTP